MHHHHLLLLFLLSTAFFPLCQASCHNQSTTLTTDKKTIIILAGQSNMAGHGGMVLSGQSGFGVMPNYTWDRYVPPECQPNPSILRFSAALQWEEAKDPLHSDVDPYSIGVGPGMPFANSVLHQLPAGSVLGLVPCAFGGTSIDQWAKGSTLYENMVRRAKAAAAAGGGGEIRAVLWYQGESDSVNLSGADSYLGKMEKLVRDIRADLEYPNLLVIQVALASGFTYLEQVRKAQMAVKLPNFVTVDAKGLELQGDNLHLTTSGEVKLGQMLADAYLQATNQGDSCASSGVGLLLTWTSWARIAMLVLTYWVAWLRF